MRTNVLGLGDSSLLALDPDDVDAMIAVGDVDHNFGFLLDLVHCGEKTQRLGRAQRTKLGT